MSTPSCLITGASRGIGQHVARRLAQEGYALTISARHEAGLRAVETELRAGGANVQAVVADLASDEDIDSLIAGHASWSDRIDLLVLNGGVARQGAIAEMPRKAYDLTLAVNLRAQFLMCQAAMPMLRAAAAKNPSHGAKVVAMASITGLASETGLAAYGASKAGLISLCQTLTVEESHHGVTATALCPGFVDTDMTEYQRETVDRAAMLTCNDVVELLLAVSRLSALATVPSIVLTRAGEQLWRA